MEFIKRSRYWIAVVVLLLPLLLRAVWFYHGLPSLAAVKEPNYSANLIPQPPISTAAPEKVTSSLGRVIVLDNHHGNQYAPSEVENFISALTQGGARVEIDNGDPSLSTRLKYASAYIVFSPTNYFTDEEINAVRSFVSAGGRLIVFADPTRGLTGIDFFSGATISQPDVDTVNPLLAPYGISVQKDYLYDLVKNEGNFRNVFFSQFAQDPLTAGLSQVVLYGSHSIQTKAGMPLITGDDHTLSSNTDSGGKLAAAVLSADGNVLALGDFSFLLPPYNTVADNGVLMHRIADFAVGGTRSHRLADFPYVFDRSVSVMATGGLNMAADVLGPIASLQNTLQVTNISLTVNAKPKVNTDQLILGALTPSEDLAAYLEPFNLGLDDPMNITIPDFGTISRSGVGLLLYQHTDQQNRLILLTDTPSDLPTLINLLTNGELSSCVIQGQIGVCSIGYGGSSYPEPTLMPGLPSLELTPTPPGG